VPEKAFLDHHEKMGNLNKNKHSATSQITLEAGISQNPTRPYAIANTALPRSTKELLSANPGAPKGQLVRAGPTHLEFAFQAIQFSESND
jgi:hypothetical protein